MKRKSIFVVVMMIMCVGLVGTVAAQPSVPYAPDASVGAGFTYQGQIKRNGALFTGTCAMQFKLWDSSAGGIQQGPMLNQNTVPVDNGVFTVQLDFGNQFKGDARWLETAAKCADDAGFTTLPRVALNPAPYAVGLMPGAQTLGNISGSAGIFRAANTGPGAALVGLATSSTGTTYGVLGNAFSPNGYAVMGYADGGATALYGWSDANGSGVWGHSATGMGVYGESALFEGVRGVSHNAGHGGVVGINDGGGIAVYGLGTTNHAVYGETTSGIGVVGKSNSNDGVWGESQQGEGVRGISHNVGHGGVVGVNDAAGGVAVYGIAPNGGYAAWLNGRTKTSVVEITGGSDLAELFNVSEDKADPGALLIIDAENPGHLTISTCAYDTKVAGIVSGAGDVKPGLTLHQEGVMEGDTEVAIAGRVYVKATAENGAIEPGDLLTTSDLPGYAMKATDPDRSYGAIIGKAMTGLKDGTGLVLVLVNLQ